MLERREIPNFNCDLIWKTKYSGNFNKFLFFYGLSIVAVFISAILLHEVVSAVISCFFVFYTSLQLSAYGYMFNLHYRCKDSVFPFTLIYGMGDIMIMLWILHVFSI